MMRFGYGMYGWGGHMLGAWLFTMLFVGLIVFVIVKLVNKRDIEAIGTKGSRTQAQALNILKERLAKGEINNEEYLEKKNLLQED